MVPPPWPRPGVQIPGETRELSIVDCMKRMEGFFGPMLLQLMSQSDALYKRNMQMAWSMGKAGLAFPTEETPTDVPQWEVDEAMQDPFAADGFTNASASGSGGTGGAPVVVIADPPQDRPGKKEDAQRRLHKISMTLTPRIKMMTGMTRLTMMSRVTWIDARLL